MIVAKIWRICLIVDHFIVVKLLLNINLNVTQKSRKFAEKPRGEDNIWCYICLKCVWKRAFNTLYPYITSCLVFHAIHERTTYYPYIILEYQRSTTIERENPLNTFNLEKTRSERKREDVGLQAAYTGGKDEEWRIFLTALWGPVASPRTHPTFLSSRVDSCLKSKV